MDQKHLVQAERHLAKAQDAYERVQVAKTLEDMESAWSDFIMAFGTVYNKLEGGSRGHPKSWTWWLVIKSDRKNDPLLNYVFQARNADEHGIVEVGARERVEIGVKNPGSHLVDGTIDEIIEQAGMPGSPLRVVRTTEFRLVRVTNSKFKDHFDPPMTATQPFRPFLPSTVAREATDRLQKIVSEARALAETP